MVLSNEKQLRNLQEGFGSIREVILDNLQFNLLDSFNFCKASVYSAL